jgi:hypothetical protein
MTAIAGMNQADVLTWWQQSAITMPPSGAVAWRAALSTRARLETGSSGFTAASAEEFSMFDSDGVMSVSAAAAAMLSAQFSRFTSADGWAETCIWTLLESSGFEL